MDANSNANEGIAVSSRVRLARNVAGLPFPLRVKDGKPYENLIDQVYNAIKPIDKFKVYKISELSETETESLVEKHLISRDLMKSKVGAAIINASETVSIMVNEEDHIRAQCMQSGFSLDAAYDVIDKIDDILSQKIPIAFDAELGYLTSWPTNLGTGLRASVMLFLPATTITNAMPSLVDTLSKIGLTVRGVYGEGSSASGYLYQVSNQISLGVTERDILNNVKAAVGKICNAEKQAREILMKRNALDIEDRVKRAYGVITNCAKLSSDEFMQLISDIKLGAYLKILKVDDVEALDAVMAKCQPANLMLACGKKLTPTERDVQRAKLAAGEVATLVQK